MKTDQELEVTRRGFLRTCATGSLALASKPIWCLSPKEVADAPISGGEQAEFEMNHDWLFGGPIEQGSGVQIPENKSLTKTTLPHCVTRLAWDQWDPTSWEHVWLYRRHFSLPAAYRHNRVFVKFDAAMVTAELSINGHPLERHQGGYLPFTRELTHALQPGENLLDVMLDARYLNVPPEGSPKGPRAVDYYLPGGMIRDASLFVVPQIYIDDVFAKPVDVLGPGRRVEITCSVDAARLPGGKTELTAELMDGDRIVSSVRKEMAIAEIGKSKTALSLTHLNEIKLWDIDSPKLYGVVITLSEGGHPVHRYKTRIGFREAKFTVDGFFLNGRRLRLFGLDRHELYPYAGYAMPARTMRRDAEILRKDFHCNVVRCSHYPQSPAFLNACDELGMMVWEETPGWGYLGNAEFQDQVVQDVGDMIIRDRNRPSIIIWGVRVNESANNQPLYKRTTALAKSLDDSRPDSGSMTTFANWQTDWHEDVFSMDDYHAAPDGTLAIFPPPPGVPYMLSETVGQRTYTARGFGNVYRRAGDVATQTKQAIYHAQAHDKALGYPRFCGVIAWCGFEYGSPQNSYQGIKYPGVADIFRCPKLGAAFYQAQVSPSLQPVIAPNFYWDFGAATPRGPGKNVAVFSNCDHLEFFVNGKLLVTAAPDRKNYPNLPYAPSFVDLDLDGGDEPELRIDGFFQGRKVVSRSFSSRVSEDQFLVAPDDLSIRGDGIDATRVVFQVTDKFGNPRLFAGGQVRFELAGPGLLVGDNPFPLAETGGVAAVWVKGTRGGSGQMTLKATHSSLGVKSIELTAEPHSERRSV